ncbi:hypothetical protein [Candidatus Alkanophaga liquidiphilum]
MSCRCYYNGEGCAPECDIHDVLAFVVERHGDGAFPPSPFTALTIPLGATKVMLSGEVAEL